jgi:hypothetical protein
MAHTQPDRGGAFNQLGGFGMDTKVCAGCGATRPLAEFNYKSIRKGLRHARCRECTREQVLMHYQAHQPYYLQKARKRKVRITREQREWLLKYLLLHPCVDCGESDPRCLDFDHVREKKLCSISRMVGNYGWETIEREVKKCEVRCANCHRKRTAERHGFWNQFFGSGSARSSTG